MQGGCFNGDCGEEMDFGCSAQPETMTIEENPTGHYWTGDNPPEDDLFSTIQEEYDVCRKPAKFLANRIERFSLIHKSLVKKMGFSGVQWVFAPIEGRKPIAFMISSENYPMLILDAENLVFSTPEEIELYMLHEYALAWLNDHEVENEVFVAERFAQTYNASKIFEDAFKELQEEVS